ncbi:MAG: hypothetical protein IPF66_02015 [Holophagales bacterium]|nr:hypothetical protein [Holophagales bacterium]
MTLEKRIPSGGGLGGGSSDAAVTLLGLSALWELDLPLDLLSRWAPGSVPTSLSSSTAGRRGDSDVESGSSRSPIFHRRPWSS